MNATALEVLPPQRIFSFAPTTFQEALKFADLLATSDIVPKQYKGKPADILVAMQYGAELGLQPLQALNSVAVINGRPGLFGDGLLGVILSQPDCLDLEEMDLPEILAAKKATCTVKRKGRKPVTRTFTWEMAEKANLTSKDGPWKQYPARQMQMRARGFACRDAYADVLRGIKTVEELNDYAENQVGDGPYQTLSDLPPLKDDPITQDEARAFLKAWKESGWTMDEAKAFLKSSLGTESSLKIKASQYQQAMAWATKAQGKPEAPAANGNGHSREKEICFELFKILGMDDVKQATAIKEHTKEQATDWKALNLDLEKQLPVEK